MKKVSIIVPAYKVERYISRCVDSLLSQTLNDTEIILVDDGSPDSCSEICDCYTKDDSRIITVHKLNGGLSSARNAGLAISGGKYVGFVDSDDDVDSDMYEKMYLVAEEYKVDFVMSDYYRITAAGERILKTLDIDGGYYPHEKIVNDIYPQLIMRECVDYGPLLSVCHCLYNKDFLDGNALTFDERVLWSEDNIFSAIMGHKAKCLYYMKGVGLYHYYNNSGTITTSYREGAWNVYCIMNDHLHSYFDNVNNYNFSRQLKLHVIYYACNCISMEIQYYGSQAIKRIDSILGDQHTIQSFRNFELPNVPVKLKIQLILMKYKQSKLIYLLKK